MEETGKTEEEIDRTTLWKKARQLKTGGFDPDVKLIVDKIDEPQIQNSGEVTATNDVLTQALGTGERRGHVRGMGKFITPQLFFQGPRTVKQLFEIEKKVDERFNKLEAEIEKLKRCTSASEAGSCQGGIEDDFGDEPLEESHDKSCFLAVDVASNIVAKGALINYNVLGENLEVLLEICLQEEALVPIPCEQEPSIEKVKDAVGYILTWPRHLVIRCIDLEKVAAKPMRNTEKPLKQTEQRKEGKKRLRDEENEKGRKGDAKKRRDQEITQRDVAKKNEKEEGNDEEGKENKKERGKVDGKEVKQMDDAKKKEKDKGKVDGKQVVQQRRMTRGQRKTRIRIENNGVLKMTAIMVDGQVAKVDSVRVQCEDNLFGYESYTYLNWNDFEAVFTLDELSGAVISTYMMYLYEQIKHVRKMDRGICFTSSFSISPLELKGKSQNIDDSSRSIA